MFNRNHLVVVEPVRSLLLTHLMQHLSIELLVIFSVLIRAIRGGLGEVWGRFGSKPNRLQPR